MPAVSKPMIDTLSSTSRRFCRFRNCGFASGRADDQQQQHDEERRFAALRDGRDEAACALRRAWATGACTGAAWVEEWRIMRPAPKRATMRPSAALMIRSSLGIGARDLRADTAFVHDQHAVGHAEHFGQFARNHQHRHAVAHQFRQRAIHLRLRADVDAARRFVDDQHLRIGREPFAEHDLLLIAARQRADRRIGITRLQAQPRAPLGWPAAFRCASK